MKRLVTATALIRVALLAVLIMGCLTAIPFASGGAAAAATSGELHVTWMPSFAAPGTPAKYNKVGVIKVGPSSAKNVLVLEPGTSAAAAYFVPLAKWIVSSVSGWQVWAVQRRENLLEDQSELNLYKEGKAKPIDLYNYYLGYLKDHSVTHHYQTLANSSVEFAKQWGMQVAVEDLHTVIGAAKKLGGKVVLGGHSLGGSVVTAYATWDFDGHAGADDLAGLLFIDGSSGPGAPTAAQATQELQAFEAPSVSPWLAFGGISAPFAGLFNALGSTAALLDPNGPSLAQYSGLLPSAIVPPVRASNIGQYGYALNAATSPPSLIAAQGHLGKGLAAKGPVHGWNGAGALTPIKRFATMFSGLGVADANGTEWYFPQRLTNDSAVVDNGIANPAQKVLGVDATMGDQLPKNLLMYAFGARLGGPAVLASTRLLAAQSHIPSSNLTLINRQSTYAHNDPAGAYPNNVFFDHLVPWLREVAKK